MRFWDSSALLSLLAGQRGGERLKLLLEEDPDIAMWWGTPVELVSGACRLRRTGAADEETHRNIVIGIDEVVSDADQIDPGEQIRQAALRAVRTHDLRAADALQLAAALVWTGHEPLATGFVCLDKRLRDAAEREGFSVLPTS